MRILGVSIAAAAVAVLASAAVAQTSPSTPSPPVGAANQPVGNPPEVGSPLLPATDAGLDKVAADGVSTRTVPAVPCGKAARETDGFTTGIGIPGPVKNPVNGGRE
jgi:hypothetical protein